MINANSHFGTLGYPHIHLVYLCRSLFEQQIELVLSSKWIFALFSRVLPLT